jgi:hypothetical protein
MPHFQVGCVNLGGGFPPLGEFVGDRSQEI